MFCSFNDNLEKTGPSYLTPQILGESSKVAFLRLIWAYLVNSCHSYLM